MRIYKNFTEAFGEIKRDLKEMGTIVKTQTYQDKFIGDKDSFKSYELQNYIYTVTQPNLEHLHPVLPWADAEFAERLQSNINPGNAYKLRREVWDEFLEVEGKFAYTYSERIGNQIWSLVDQLKIDPYSRQHFLSVWDREADPERKFSRRIPCSLGYIFQVRPKLNITYLMRSCDYATHFENDVYLAHRLQVHISRMIDIPVGNFTQYIASFHVFKKDVEGVF